jgi:hypothetical protein
LGNGGSQSFFGQQWVPHLDTGQLQVPGMERAMVGPRRCAAIMSREKGAAEPGDSDYNDDNYAFQEDRRKRKSGQKGPGHRREVPGEAQFHTSIIILAAWRTNSGLQQSVPITSKSREGGGALTRPVGRAAGKLNTGRRWRPHPSQHGEKGWVGRPSVVLPSPPPPVGEDHALGGGHSVSWPVQRKTQGNRTPTLLPGGQDLPAPP